MRFRGSRVALALACLVHAACAMKVVDLDPTSQSVVDAPVPFPDVVVVEPLYEVPDRWDEAGPYQRSFRRALQNAHLFRRVVDPGELDFTPDLVVRGEVEGRFEYSGGLNFLTWFPGPFLLMHNWRGNRYEYIAQARVDLVDAHTQEPVGHYEVSSHHKLIHRSGSPFPIFGAILIFPGLIRGGTNVGPRPLYRETLYQESYPALWEELIEAIRVDRAPYYAGRWQDRAERCGDELNARPQVGAVWADFVSCQTGSFYAREEMNAAEGVETIYTDGKAHLEIHVIDGRIVRWQVLEQSPRRSIERGPPPQ